MFENGTMPYWYDWGPEEADRLAGEIVAEKTSGKMPAAERRAVFRILPISFGRRALTAMTTLFPIVPLWSLAVMSWVMR